MQRVKLTDRKIQALEPGDDDLFDTVADRMFVRGDGSVPDVGFYTYRRFPGGKGPTRRELGRYVGPAMAPQSEPTDEDLLALERLTLAQARRKDGLVAALIARGIDPKDDLARRRAATVEARKNSFAAVFSDWVLEKLAGERKGKIVERDVRREFLPALGERPITEVTDLEVLAIVNAKKRRSIRKQGGAPGQARNELGHVRRLFEWAVDQRVYGLKVNPLLGIKPAKIFGKKRTGTRVLNNDELFALWRATGRVGYPAGAAYRLLMLTALRLNEAARAAWPEFDPAVVRALRRRKSGEVIDWSRVANEPLAWVIPAERMKGRNDEPRAHLVPLIPDILALLQGLPLFDRGPYLFSTTHGRKPSTIGDKVKKEIDRRMLRTLKALARRRGDDAAAVTLPAWTNHDIRRTVRSNLSRLKVAEEAREAVIAHKRPGIKGVYDLYDYHDEKREALEMWAARLRSIVEPPPPANNIIKMPAVA